MKIEVGGVFGLAKENQVRNTQPPQTVAMDKINFTRELNKRRLAKLAVFAITV